MSFSSGNPSGTAEDKSSSKAGSLCDTDTLRDRYFEFFICDRNKQLNFTVQQRYPIVYFVYSERLAEFTGTAAKILRFFRTAVPDHKFYTLKRLHRTDENGFPPPGNSGCYVEAVVNTVDKINVNQAAPLEHGMVPVGSAAEGMACGVVLGVSLSFYYYS